MRGVTVSGVASRFAAVSLLTLFAQLMNGMMGC